MGTTQKDGLVLRLKKRLRPYYVPFLVKMRTARSSRAMKVHGEDLLLKSKEALEEIGVHFWLDFGTLLGVYRDGKLISHDFDVDIAVFLDDYSPKILDALTKHGFVHTHRYDIDEGRYGLEQGFSFKHIGFDIFFYRKMENRICCHLFPVDDNGNKVVKEVSHSFSGFEKIKFLGTEFNIPKNAKQRLIDTYGENFHIPDKNWNTPKDALNSRIINKKCTYTKFH